MELRVGPTSAPDRYRLVAPHSRGGEGELWRAEILLGTVPIPVAVKMSHPEVGSSTSPVQPTTSMPGPSASPDPHPDRHPAPDPHPDPHLDPHGRTRPPSPPSSGTTPSSDRGRAAERWEQQTELLRTLDHPHLVRVREVFEGPGPHPPGEASSARERRVYLVMNWVEGPTISRWVDEHHPRPAELLAVLRGIAGALDYLHAGADTAGVTVLHRDVKPANIIVSDGVAKLVDFGLARLLDPSDPSMTMAGTPAFLAPEVITGQHFSPASDRYAFAGTVYQLLTGANPNVFAPAQMREQLEQRTEGAGGRFTGAGGRLAELLLAGMHLEADRRPAQLGDWLDAVAAALPADVRGVPGGYVQDDNAEVEGEPDTVLRAPRDARTPPSTPTPAPVAGDPGAAVAGDAGGPGDRELPVAGDAAAEPVAGDPAAAGAVVPGDPAAAGAGGRRRGRRAVRVGLGVALMVVLGGLVGLGVRDAPSGSPGSAAAGEGVEGDGEGGGDITGQQGRADGSQWQRVRLNEAATGGAGDSTAMLDVVAADPAKVAVGASADDDGETVAAVWRMNNSTRWERVEHDDAVFGGAGSHLMWSVTAGGPGLVAVGDDEDRGAAAVWVSRDGTTWERVEHEEAVFGGAGAQQMRSVTAGGPGLVAVGLDTDRRAAAVWVSPNGLAWERVAHDEAVFGGDEAQWMWSVTEGGPGLVAVGWDGELGGAAVWTSPDGLAWERVEQDAAVFASADPDELQVMWSVTAGGPGLVAVGWDQGPDAVAVWVSDDGFAWERVAHDEAVFGGVGSQAMNAVTTEGLGLVAVGRDTGRGSAAAVWVSDDGVAWQRTSHEVLTFGGGGVQEMMSVAMTGSGVVAVGFDTNAPAVWTSR